MKAAKLNTIPSPITSDGFGSTFGTSDGLGHTEISGLGAGGAGKTWTGATWANAAGKASNTPTQGSESVTNGGMEGTYDDESGGGGGTVNVAAGWDQTGVETDGSDLLDAELIIVHGGSKSQKVQVDAANEGIATGSNVFLSGNWYVVSAWLYATAGQIVILDSAGAYFLRTVSPGASWTNYILTARATSDRKLIFRSWTGGASTFYVDDVSVKALTLSTLFASTTHSTADVLVTAALVLTSGTQAGVVVNLDSASTPANFVIAYHDGTNCKLEKCVAGTYTTVITAAATYSSGAEIRVIKDGTAYRLYYNNALVGTGTISDAGIISNTLAGLFSTYSANSLDNFTVYSRGTDGSYNSILNEVANG